MKERISLLLISMLALQSLGCGTIIHPERRGQRGGRLDPSIVILDCVGLLFFIIPGLVAFAVDFGNGTIYLPGGSSGLTKIRFDLAGDPKANAEAVLSARTGRPVKLDAPGMEVVKLGSMSELRERFASPRVLIARH